MPEQLVNILWSVAGIVITALFSWLTTYLIKLINSKIKDKELATFLTKIVTIVETAVKTVYQEFVDVLKKEGKFTPEAQAEAKEKAVDIIKGQLTEDLTLQLQETFGDVDKWIENQIEATIYNLKF